MKLPAATPAPFHTIDPLVQQLVNAYTNCPHMDRHKFVKQYSEQLGLDWAGSGVDKVCVFDVAHRWVYKFDRQPMHKSACLLEARTVAAALAAGLPVAIAEAVDDHVSRMEVCTPINDLDERTGEWDAAIRDMAPVAEQFENWGVYDTHAGNMAIHRDGRIVCIDLSHNHHSA